MIADIILIVMFVFLGGVLGVVVEFQKYLYPIYLAFVLLIASEFLKLLQRVITLNARK